MNILIFSWRDPSHPLAGGAEQVVHEHAKGWVRSGHQVILFSSDFKGEKEENLDGVNIIRRGNQLAGVQVAAFFWYLFGKHERFDLVIDCFHGIPFFTPLYVRIKKVAIIQEVAREVWFLNHLPKPLNWIVGALGYFIEPVVFVLYKNIPFITGSNSAKEDLINMGIPSKNINIVPHGVIILRPKRQIKEKVKTIIFLGALARDKGIEDALAAFSIINKSGDFRFWVVGKGSQEYLNYLRRSVLELGISAKIRFFGFVPQEKKFELLSRAHVLVNPSKREGWGLVNIEANAAGLPVVAFKSRGLIDSVSDGYSGIICEKNTPEMLAENIYNLLRNDQKYMAISKNAKKWSQKFTWDNSCRLSLRIVEEMNDDH